MTLHSVVALAWTLAACTADEAAAPPDRGPDVVVDAGSQPLACTQEGASRACTCASGAQGRKTCKDGAYLACTNCRGESTDAGRSPTPNLTKCKAGYYVGHMEGRYKPGFAGFGLGEGALEVEFKSEARDGNPPLALTLEERTENSGGEFFSFTVGNGCMTGLARSGNTDNPFAARLTGDLDCATGSFVGVMEGVYTLLDVAGLDYKFKGPITAQFDPAKSELSDGEWSADEPPTLSGQRAGGGTGTWGATYKSAKPPTTTADDPCQGIASTATSDAGPPQDAGASGRADAEP